MAPTAVIQFSGVIGRANSAAAAAARCSDDELLDRSLGTNYVHEGIAAAACMMMIW